MSASVVHVVSGLGRLDGGPSYSVPRLSRAQKSEGASTKVCSVAVTGNPPLDNIDAELCVQDFANVPIMRSMRLSGELRRRLSALVPVSALVHSHGLWLAPNLEAGFIARQHRKPLVVSPRGMVSKEALAFSPLKKQLMWGMFQRRAYKDAALWHATSDAEAADIRRLGIRAPIAVIPNGVDSVVASNGSARPPLVRTMLYLGRLHPKKGLTGLIRAWSKIEEEFPGWRLNLVGPDEVGHAQDLATLIGQLGSKTISVSAPVFGIEKDRAFRDASVFVLPTLNENFGIAVAEALAAGTPAIVTKGAPWSGLRSERCGWWIDHGVDPLVAALREAMTLPEERLRELGERGRLWVEREFGWDRVASDMLAAYRWIIQGGIRPSFVLVEPSVGELANISTG